MTVNVEEEAKRFWREMKFNNICCNDKDCKMDVDLVDDKVEVSLVKHNYVVTIHRIESMAGMVNVKDPAKWWESVGTLSHSQNELNFWNRVAELYQKIPLWMFEFELDGDHACICETTTIVAQGCQCGGI